MKRARDNASAAAWEDGHREGLAAGFRRAIDAIRRAAAEEGVGGEVDAVAIIREEARRALGGDP